MKKCLICGESLQNSKMKGLLACKRCGFITANLNLTDDEIKQLYSEKYYKGEEYADYLSDKEIIQKNFRKRLKRIARYSDDFSGKTLFEIGCAYGFFLQVADKMFHKVSGIDISEDAVEYAKKTLKLDAHAGDFLLFEMAEKYDIICMWDTIEHLEKPELFIQKSHECLKPDGLLCITTGDIESLNAKLRGRKWRQIHPPTHLHYFSKRTLTMLLQEHGFQVIETSYPANTISMNTVLYTILCLKTRHEKIYSLFKKIGITKWNIDINLHDFMFVIAKKGQ